jgi:hypothetical protein
MPTASPFQKNWRNALAAMWPLAAYTRHWSGWKTRVSSPPSLAKQHQSVAEEPIGRVIVGTVRATVNTEGQLPLWIYGTFAAIVCLTGVASGWITGRLHQKDERAIMPLYASSVLLYLLGFAIAVGINQSPLSVGGSLEMFWINSVILASGILVGRPILLSWFDGIPPVHHNAE